MTTHCSIIVTAEHDGFAIWHVEDNEPVLTQHGIPSLGVARETASRLAKACVVARGQDSEGHNLTRMVVVG